MSHLRPTSSPRSLFAGPVATSRHTTEQAGGDAHRSHLAGLLARVVALCVVSFCAGLGPAPAGATAADRGLPVGPILVDPDATGNDDGSSWADAYTSLDTALSVAVAGDQIWIARGIYRPGAPAIGTAETFEVPVAVTLVGGFAGGETTIEESDPAGNPTILSGDLDGDDLDPDADGVISHPVDLAGTNAFHVVTLVDNGAEGPARLSGITITAGAALGDGPDEDRGGAVDCAGLPVHLDDVRIEGNAARSRAALWDCRPLVAMGSTFRNNFAGDVGAVTTSGGTFIECLFEENRAGTQGSVFYLSGKTVYVGNSVVRGNSSPRVPLRILDGFSTFENVLFIGNSGGTGVLELLGSPHVDVINATFVGNHSAAGLGAIHVNAPGGTVDLANTIFWNNRGGAVPPNENTDRGLFAGQPLTLASGNLATVTVSHSLVQDSVAGGGLVVPGVLDGGGNTQADPLMVFVPPVDEAPFVTANPRLRSGSPAIDAGNADFLEDPGGTDLDGNPRTQGAALDLGAFESGPIFLDGFETGGTELWSSIVR